MKFQQDDKIGSFTISYHHDPCNSLALCMCLLQTLPLFNLRIYFLEQFQLHSKIERKIEISHRTAPQPTASLLSIAPS